MLELLQNLDLFSYDTFMTKKHIKARLVSAIWFLHLILLQWQYQCLWTPHTVFSSVLLICSPAVLFICFHSSLDTRHLNDWVIELEGTDSLPCLSVQEGSAVLQLMVKILKTFWAKHLRNQQFHFLPGHRFIYCPRSAPVPIYLFSNLLSSTLWFSLTLLPQPTAKGFHERSLCFFLLCLRVCWASLPALFTSYASLPA